MDLATRIRKDGIRGDFVECGVGKGGVAGLLGLMAEIDPTPRELWLFDSFQGLPEPSVVDGKEAASFAGQRSDGKLMTIGKCIGTVEEVSHFLFSELRLAQHNVHVVPGWFQETLPSHARQPIALLHIDADWYDSVKVALAVLWPFMSEGGFVVIDDYGYWIGARSAVADFLKALPYPIQIHRKGHTQAYLRKPPS